MAGNRRGEPGYENRFRNRPLSGGRDLSCFRPERLPELHSPSPAGFAGQFMGAPYASHYLWVIFAFQVIGSGTSAGQPLRAVGGGCAGAGDCQHSYFPRLDGPGRPSAGPLRGRTVGRDLHRRATGLCRVVPVALAGTSLRRSGT
jgi:hypothetical protein